MKTCRKCGKTFKNRDFDSENHFDLHTPYWTHDKVKLSGADQIRIMLAKWAGGWEKYLAQEKKRGKDKDYDFKKAEKLQKFEQRNGIEFVVCDSKVESYRELQATTQGKCLP